MPDILEVPAEVTSWIGAKRHEEESEFTVEIAHIATGCASVENGNPLYWDEKTAQDLTGGATAPLSMISVWCRPHFWAPWRSEEGLALRLHFDLKEALQLPEAIMSDDELILYEPVRPGDRVKSWQILKSLSDPKTTKVGRGRFWTIEVHYVNQQGELLVVEKITGFGYRRDV